MKKVTKSFKKFAVIIVLLLMIASIVFSASALTNNAAFAAENTEEEEQTEVLSYKDIFEEYYNAVCSDLDKVSEDYVLTLDNFINGYYYNGFCYDEEVTIADYTSVIYEYVIENGSYEYEDELIQHIPIRAVKTPIIF